MTKKSKATIIGLSVAGALLILGIGAIVVAVSNNHNWSLGLASQKGNDDIAQVQAAVDSVQHDAIVDTHVKNANTSGTPFGHSIRVNVLLDADDITPKDRDEIAQLGAAIQKAIEQTGVKDSYDLFIGIDVVTTGTVTYGPGTADNPATSAESMIGVDYVYDVSFEVK